MKRSIHYAMILSCCIGILSTACLAEKATTKADAEALVKKTVAAIQKDGAEKTYAAITGKDPQYIDNDLYPVVYDMTGKCLSHGANAKLVGKDLMDVQDADGVYFVKDRVEKAKTSNTFWQDYKYINPMSRKIEPKEAFCEKLHETVICAGVYKAK